MNVTISKVSDAMEETHIAHHFSSALLLKSGEAENIIMTVDALFSSGT